MGRVGSSSIGQVLHNNDVAHIHGHWILNEYPVAEFPTTKPNFMRVVKANPDIKVVTPIREPLARNISAFFRGLDRYCKDQRHVTATELQDIFINQYNMKYPDQWFELELMQMFDFNPFESKFDHKKGYKIYKSGKHRILIIRLEDTERILSEALRKLLGIRNARMVKKNEFSTKYNFMSQLYKEFKSLDFPKDFLTELYQLDYARHFYPKSIDT